MKRLLFVALLVTGTLLLQGSAASRAFASQDNQFTQNVPLVLTSATCPAISVPINGVATYQGVFNMQTNPQGTTQFITNVLATGTVMDALGNVYTFNYHNHDSTTVTADGSAVELQNDHFNLVGSGPDAGLHVGFVFVATLTDFQVINIRGDVSCDPI